jgi:hypothetical protein
MKLIMETINKILISEFKKYLKKGKDVVNILKDIYKQLIDSVFSSESPKFEETNAIHFFEILFYSFLQKFKLKYEEQKKLFVEKKQKYLDLINIIISQIRKKINSKKYEYQKKYNLYKDDQKKYEEELKENAINYFNNDYNKKWMIGKFCDNLKNFVFKTKDLIKEYKNTNEFSFWKNHRQSIDEPHEDTYWKKYEKKEKDIIKHITNLKNEKDMIKIQIIVNKAQEEISNIPKDYIESNNLNQCLNLADEINSIVKDFKRMTKSDIFINKNIPDNIFLYEIKENDLNFIYDIISQCDYTSHYFSLFKVQENLIRNNNLENYNLNYVYDKQDSNFIFAKDNNKPVFLNKRMKINLGLYVLGCELKNIGSISIKNNYNNILNYSINQEPNNEIIAFINSDKELNPCQDLNINFKLNIPKIKAGFFTSKFDLILIYENKEFDKIYNKILTYYIIYL